MIANAEGIYQFLIEQGYSEGDIEKQIEHKVREFGGFMTREGVLFLIAKENGFDVKSPDIDPEIYEEIEQDIDYDEFLIKIFDIQENMSNIVILGRIKTIFKGNQFTRKDGTPGRVGSFIVDDGSEAIKITLWDDQINIMNDNYFKFNEVVRVVGGYAKRGYKDLLEVNVGRKGKVMLAPKDLNPKIIPPALKGNERKLVNEGSQEKKDQFIESLTGTVSKIIEFKEIDLKNGEKSFLLKFELNVNSISTTIIAWKMNAINTLKAIELGKPITLTNCFSKVNEYSQQEEIHITKNTRIIKKDS